MSHRRALRARLDTFHEVRTLLSAMKSIAFAELHRLAAQGESLRLALATLEQAAAEFVAFHPRPRTRAEGRACVVVGSERAFCGEFNAPLAQAAAARVAHGERVLLVGARLDARCRDAGLHAEAVQGATVAEDLGATLERVVAWLDAAQREAHAEGLRAHVLYQDPDSERLVHRALLPLALPEPGPARAGYPPLLTLPPQVFLAALAEQALLFALHEAFSASLVAENRQRLAHMELALARLETRVTTLAHRLNAERQAEITEEIEIIMLSAGAADEDAEAGRALR